MMLPWIIRVVAVASIAVSVVVCVADAALGFPGGGLYPIYAAVAAVFIGVGWLIVERQPGNAEGLLLVTFGVAFDWYLPADFYIHRPGPLPGVEFAALFVSLLDAPMFIVIALTLLLFPDGRPPSPRWRWAIRLALVGVGLGLVGWVFGDQPMFLFPEFTSPLVIRGLPGGALVYAGYAIMLVLLLVGAAALVVRWRRGSTIERAQIKWVVAAAVVLLVTEIVNVATFDPTDPYSPAGILATVAIVLVPLAMGIAILRYRLYDIDRIISRTLSYAIVTGLLGAVFVGVILLLQTVLAGVVGKGGIPVAVSTLAVFALFQPVLRRVRRAVDRRFDRARYDGERTAGAFAERLRWETDMERVTGDLRATVDRAIAPTSLAIWLRTGRAPR